MSETLLHLRPKTDKEKLLWAEAQIKELKQEKAASDFRCGELESELSEYKHKMKSEQVGALILKNNTLRKTNETKNKKLGEQKKLIQELQLNLVRLQTTGSINKKLNDNAG